MVTVLRVVSALNRAQPACTADRGPCLAPAPNRWRALKAELGRKRAYGCLPCNLSDMDAVDRCPSGGRGDADRLKYFGQQRRHHTATNLFMRVRMNEWNSVINRPTCRDLQLCKGVLPA